MAPRWVMTFWISPGPWCEKPLWSFRQQVEVSKMLRLGTLLRHGRCVDSSSHLLCWIVCDALTMANAS
jgi:hypothetical protein